LSGFENRGGDESTLLIIGTGANDFDLIAFFVGRKDVFFNWLLLREMMEFATATMALVER